MSAGLRAGNASDAYLLVDGVDKVKIDTAGTLTTTTTSVDNLASNTNATILTWGHLTPYSTNTIDLGTAALRWRNVYTNDLQLSNGIGDYTIVEGEEDLFLYNNKTGKTFKFALIEVDPSIVPPKAATQ